MSRNPGGGLRVRLMGCHGVGVGEEGALEVSTGSTLRGRAQAQGALEGRKVDAAQVLEHQVAEGSPAESWYRIGPWRKVPHRRMRWVPAPVVLAGGLVVGLNWLQEGLTGT